MPVVFRHGPYRVFFYSNEGDPREPMHVHVKSGGGEAKVWLVPDVSIAQFEGLNSRQLNEICAIIAGRIEIIEAAWHEHFGD